jgi:hypothetical protein
MRTPRRLRWIWYALALLLVGYLQAAVYPAGCGVKAADWQIWCKSESGDLTLRVDTYAPGSASNNWRIPFGVGEIWDGEIQNRVQLYLGARTHASTPSVASVKTTPLRTVWSVRFSYFRTCLLLGAIASVICVKARYARNTDGLCKNCGYDLRASKDRCPECATPFIAHEAQAR